MKILSYSRLRDDLRARQKDSDKLVDEVATLKGFLSAKERALAKASTENETLRARILQAEGILILQTDACPADLPCG